MICTYQKQWYMTREALDDYVMYIDIYIYNSHISGVVTDIKARVW